MKKTCIIALSFGMGEGLDNYGVSNWELAKIASHSDLPVIAQWEIARLMEKEFSKPALVSIEKEGKKYIDSYDVLSEAQVQMIYLRCTEAILIGHQDHMPRIRLIAKKLGINISSSTIYHKDIPYDPKSTQPWTRNKFKFIFHELIAWPIMFLKGQL